MRWKPRRLVAKEQQKPFDLTQGPLLRTMLLRMAPQEYVFLLSIHHIASDGWSMQVFFQELTDLYQAFAAHRPSPLPDLPVQYADYAVWQRQWLQGEALQKHVNYWKGQLQGVQTLQLPTDRRRPTLQTFAGAHHGFSLPLPLIEALRNLSQQEGVTLFMTLLAGFQVLLSRHSGQEDIVVGSYVAGRNRAELEKLMGFFLNTLVLRTDVSGNPTFRELLKRVRKMAMEAYAHQDLPFARLVEELQPQRDLSRNPLFQIVFQMLNIPGVSAPGARQPKPLHEEVQRTTTMVDITCSLWESPEGLIGDLEYNTDLFDAPTMARLAVHYQGLLEAVARTPEMRIWQLPLLTEAERQLFVQWNQTRRDYGDESSLVELFRRQTAATPQAIAFRCEGQDLSYAELDQRSERLASHLQKIGVGTGVVTGLCLERGLSMVTSLLAIFKAGGVYLPLDAAYPRERLVYMARDSGMKVLLTERGLGAVLADEIARTVYVGDVALWLEETSAPLESVRVRPEDLAYVIYTSGSTGRPKGVAVEHRQLLNRLRWMWEAYPFVDDEVSCQRTALNFVDSFWEMLGPLLKGNPTVIIPDAIARNPQALIEELRRHRVSRIWLVPSLLGVMLNDPDLQRQLPDLKFWVSSGEALSWDLFQRFHKAMPDSTLFNLYGTSEVWDATWFDPRREALYGDRVPIGRPIHNVHVHVLDPYQQPAPVGVCGELYVGGDGLARHYLGLPDLTRQKFVSIPAGHGLDGRLYRTGDMVRYLPDGNLEYLGRSELQFKMRGFRVEPGEVESVLCENPSVREAVVVARQDGSGNGQLVAYCVVASSGVSSGDLRRFLEARLPEFMVPSFVVLIEKLPLLPNGKVDRAALPDGAELRTHSDHAYVAPTTPVQESLARIYSLLLKLTNVGIHDNFFAHMGGHSLLAMQVVSRIRQELGVDLPLRTFFENPTIFQLAAIIDQRQDRPTAPSIIPRVSRDRYRIQPSEGTTPTNA